MEETVAEATKEQQKLQGAKLDQGDGPTWLCWTLRLQAEL